MEELQWGFFLSGIQTPKLSQNAKQKKVSVSRRTRAAEHISPISTFKAKSQPSSAARLTGDNLHVCSASRRRRAELIDPALGVICPDMTSVWSGF